MDSQNGGEFRIRVVQLSGMSLHGGNMTEKILVPLDGSKKGEAALLFIKDFTSKLAQYVRIEIHLLQVINSDGYNYRCLVDEWDLDIQDKKVQRSN